MALNTSLLLLSPTLVSMHVGWLLGWLLWCRNLQPITRGGQPSIFQQYQTVSGYWLRSMGLSQCHSGLARFNTRVRVGSLFVFFGRVFATVSGSFSVDSEFVATSTEGTEFTVSIDRLRRGPFSVALGQGILRCEPRAGRWRTVRMKPGERLSSEGRGQPAVSKLQPQEHAEGFDCIAPLRRTGALAHAPASAPTGQPAPGNLLSNG